MARNGNIRRILINDDGSLLGDSEPALTVRELKEKMVDTYRDTPVDALLWCLGNREVYGYESQLGEIPIEDKEQEQDHRYVKRARTLRKLMKEGSGPLSRCWLRLVPVVEDEQSLRRRS